MNLTRCSQPLCNCGCGTTQSNCSSSRKSQRLTYCCIARVPPANLASIVDINWNGSTSLNLVRLVTRPTKTSFILGTDTLPIGYTYDNINNILYFPPDVRVSTDQFAIWTSQGQDSCGNYVWEATSICVAVECGNCIDLQ